MLHNHEELEKEITEHLDEDAQQKMAIIIKDVLADELAFITEVEIRRKAFRESHPDEPYQGNRMTDFS
ncbi:hypothetical protein ACA30_13205 [Virgibacillus soli]|uniref:Uncharacterized protein n=1 Tax=Lederbergia galactosidilytica TaxID=217031 RepID=A0A0Q9YJZ9_9BACI|nr:hypothetical protein ACA30_13205 [Virgibacillus soli]KRG16849.1 hypothetical protein ACA29_02920 [Lederbergia galactosidilytica]